MLDIVPIARALPGVSEGIACAGTALESSTFQVGKKSFLFVSRTQARLKLGASVAEARKLGIPVGANGWATIALDATPGVAVLRRWIAESHALVSGPASPKPAAKSRTAKKRT